jgi:hypothetical protein
MLECYVAAHHDASEMSLFATVEHAPASIVLLHWGRFACANERLDYDNTSRCHAATPQWRHRAA